MKLREVKVLFQNNTATEWQNCMQFILDNLFPKCRKYHLKLLTGESKPKEIMRSPRRD